MIPARADFEQLTAGSREEYLRVNTQRIDGQLWATPYGNQSSGVLRSISASDALALVPLGSTIAHGGQIDILLLDSLLY
jgi:molybdopterin molybdotransferase